MPGKSMNRVCFDLSLFKLQDHFSQRESTGKHLGKDGRQQTGEALRLYTVKVRSCLRSCREFLRREQLMGNSSKIQYVMWVALFYVSKNRWETSQRQSRIYAANLLIKHSKRAIFCKFCRKYDASSRIFLGFLSNQFH